MFTISVSIAATNFAIAMGYKMESLTTDSSR